MSNVMRVNHFVVAALVAVVNAKATIVHEPQLEARGQ